VKRAQPTDAAKASVAAPVPGEQLVDAALLASRDAARSATEPQPVGEAIGGKRTCEVCGNDYDKAILIVQNGTRHVFDCFECAIHALAPTCAHCGCRILGHGMEHDGAMYCCAHCAEARGVKGLKDRA
jgi:hypothetical protein